MSIRVKILLCVLAISAGNAMYGQREDLEVSKQNIIEQRIELIASLVDESVDLDYTNLLEDFSYYFENPIDLNKGDFDALRELYLVNEVQINALQRHLEMYGPLKSIFELQSVNHFDLNTIRLIQPFITVGAPNLLSTFSWRDLWKEGSHDLFLRYRRTIQQQAGYLPDPQTGEAPAFLGSPDYLFTRYRFQYKKNIIAGFTLEKDAGESLERGPDFYSAHLFIRNNTRLKALAIGDFQAQFGQGLTFWNGLGFGKSPFVMNTKRNANGLRPYTSVNEALFLRGGGATIKLGKFELTALYSNKNIDGNRVNAVDSAAVDDGLVVSSLLLSGLHRTPNELADKGAVNEQVGAGNIKYQTRTFSAGLIASHTVYSAAVTPDQALYQINRFSGKTATNIGLDYQKVFRNFNLFGETSRSANGGFATLNGIVGSLHPRLSVSVLQRWFSDDFQTRYFNVFSENTIPQNERGVFAGFEANIAKGWNLTAYTDQVRFPWLKFRIDAPSRLNENFIQLNYKPDKKQDFYVRYRIRERSINAGDEMSRIDFTIPERIQEIRLNAIYQPHPNLQMRSRAEWRIYQRENQGVQRGYLVYQDFIWKKQGSKISFNTRYAIFNCPDFNTRIWAYESDVLFAFSIPAHSGLGTRAYAMIKWDIRRGMDLWVRYAQWVYTDRQEIGSGNTLIEGQRRGDLTVQLRYQF